MNGDVYERYFLEESVGPYGFDSLIKFGTFMDYCFSNRNTIDIKITSIKSGIQFSVLIELHECVPPFKLELDIPLINKITTRES
ncbi:hypothetical protein TetV_587 [Tetraselmis virus 1]|uniref:Uncharacterized protein n=1 Tax=Tetraselmis virus 1 TaxID=2060617 RepID=A0A2P0VPD4_9VIRU|nr:hypothetical protein QJ968_gp467 [Tetraselmis virus 1]AUF82669.1 hypothetical protein TetV_587 [Tetraselmis virus 1]